MVKFNIAAVKKTLVAAGFTFDPLAVHKNRKTGAIIVNLPVVAVAALTAAGYTVTTNYDYFIVVVEG